MDKVERNTAMSEMLLGITYSEFDNHIGTKLLYSYPPNCISKESFESLSDYVIVGKHLCGKVITVKTAEFQYVNYSVAIDNTKYDRNALLFSVGFLLGLDVETEPFEPVLGKLARTLHTVEIETEYLFQEATKARIQDLFAVLYHELLDNHESLIKIDEANFLAVRLTTRPVLPTSVHDYDVPILATNWPVEALQQLNWDITLSEILGRIDGLSFVKKIATQEPKMDVDIVKRGIRLLMYYNIVILSDVFKFCNTYQLTRTAASALRNNDTVEKIQLFAGIPLPAPTPNRAAHHTNSSKAKGKGKATTKRSKVVAIGGGGRGGQSAACECEDIVGERREEEKREKRSSKQQQKLPNNDAADDADDDGENGGDGGTQGIRTIATLKRAGYPICHDCRKVVLDEETISRLELEQRDDLNGLTDEEGGGDQEGYSGGSSHTAVTVVVESYPGGLRTIPEEKEGDEEETSEGKRSSQQQQQQQGRHREDANGGEGDSGDDDQEYDDEEYEDGDAGYEGCGDGDNRARNNDRIRIHGGGGGDETNNGHNNDQLGANVDHVISEHDRDLCHKMGLFLPDEFEDVYKDFIVAPYKLILRFLLAMRCGKKVSDVLMQIGPSNLDCMNLPRIIAMAQHLGIIRRVHEYPVYVRMSNAVAERWLDPDALGCNEQAVPAAGGGPTSISTIAATTAANKQQDQYKDHGIKIVVPGSSPPAGPLSAASSPPATAFYPFSPMPPVAGSSSAAAHRHSLLTGSAARHKTSLLSDNTNTHGAQHMATGAAASVVPFGSPKPTIKNQVPFSSSQKPPLIPPPSPQIGRPLASQNSSPSKRPAPLPLSNNLNNQSKIAPQPFKPAPPNPLRQLSPRDAAAAQQLQQPLKGGGEPGKEQTTTGTMAGTTKDLNHQSQPLPTSGPGGAQKDKDRDREIKEKEKEKDTPPPLPPYTQRLAAAMSILDGSMHLDAVCCMFELNPIDILKSPDVDIVYK